ncbi:MAG: GWxTD domain-containing protein [Candidatus Kapaibacteriales bacterium]
MKIYFITFFCFLLDLLNLFAAPLNVYVDFAVFRKDDSQNFVEIYYGFLDTSLCYKEKGDAFFANLSMEISFYLNDSLFEQNVWDVYNEKKNLLPNVESEYLLVGQKNFLVPAGKPVKFTIKAIDLNDSLKRMVQTFEIENPIYKLSTIQASDVQIAQIIESIDTAQFLWQREFLKGKYYVIPNPTREIIGKNPKLFTYFEYYIPNNKLYRNLTIEYRIFDLLNNEVYYNYRKVKAKSNAQMDISGFALDALHSGAYFFEVKVIDSLDNSFYSSKRRKVYLINPDMPPEPVQTYTESVLFSKSKFAILKDNELDKEFEMAKYIATEYEKQLYKELLTTDAKKKFLFSFWRRRNPDTAMTFNQAYEDFLRKVEYSNRFFSVGKAIEGWKSDRGRILIQYGEPTSREFYPRQGTNRSYEVWFYAKQQGGLYFYFVDLIGNGNYILVHSTSPGEVFNETWFTDFVTGTNYERMQKLLLR